MRVLLDESLPRQLGAQLSGHDVVTVQSLGWSGLRNGELLRLAAGEGIDVREHNLVAPQRPGAWRGPAGLLARTGRLAAAPLHGASG